MATPYKKLTQAEIVALLTTQVGNLKPYQLRQINEGLSRITYEYGSDSDVSIQDTISTIFTGRTDNP